MQSNHAEITVREDKITLKSLTENGRVMVNGEQVDRRERVLQPNDRLVFGATQMWVFRHPAVEAKGDQFINGSMINYDFILNEIATKSGLDVIPADSANRQGRLPFSTYYPTNLSIMDLIFIFIRLGSRGNSGDTSVSGRGK